MADIITARYVIFAFGFLLAIACSFFYSHLMRYEFIGKVIVWVGLVMIFAMMIVLTGLCWNTAKVWSAENPSQHSNTSILALKVSILCV